MAGSLYLRFTTGGVQAASANQWAPDVVSHDPNPPLALEDMPFAQADWPNPIVRASSAMLRTQLRGIAGGAVPPIAQWDWPNPRGKAFPTELRTWTNPGRTDVTSPTNLIGRAPLITPYSRRSFAAAIQSQLPSVPPPAAPPATPIAPVEWPLPRGKAHPAELRTFTAGPQPQPAVNPFAQTDWPVPAGRAAQRQAPAANLLEGTLAPPVVAAPFAQDDWPLPGRAVHPIGLRTWSVNLLQSTLEPPPEVARRPFDWPNPRGKAPLRDYGWYGNLLQGTLFPGDPRRPWHIDNPRGKTYPSELRTWATLPPPGSIPVDAVPIYGWGARGGIGGQGRDPWGRIGTPIAPDGNDGIGTNVARDANKGIGSASA